MGIWDLNLGLIPPFPQGEIVGLTLGSGRTSLIYVYRGVISGLKGMRVGVKCGKFGHNHIFTSRLLLKQLICCALCAPHPGVTIPLPALPTPWGALLAISSTKHHLGGFHLSKSCFGFAGLWLHEHIPPKNNMKAQVERARRRSACQGDVVTCS